MEDIVYRSLVRAHARFPLAVRELVREWGTSLLRRRDAEGRWSPLEILVHLRDEEMLDFRPRAQAASQGTDQSIALVSIAQDLEDFAADSRDDRLAALALIKRGEALRAELHYRRTDASKEELAKQIRPA